MSRGEQLRMQSTCEKKYIMYLNSAKCERVHVTHTHTRTSISLQLRITCTHGVAVDTYTHTQIILQLRSVRIRTHKCVFLSYIFNSAECERVAGPLFTRYKTGREKFQIFIFFFSLSWDAETNSYL